MAGPSYIDVRRAIELLSIGEVVAIPTDTVYGLAASLSVPNAIEKLFDIKGREATRAIPVLVDTAARLSTFGRDVPPQAYRLAEAFWPGALTMVVPAADLVPEGIHRGAGTVGLRMPDCAMTLEIILGSGGGLAVTSANLSGQAEARSPQEVYRALGERVTAIVDGGPVTGSKPSTVVDLTGREPRILREGALTREAILDAAT